MKYTFFLVFALLSFSLQAQKTLPDFTIYIRNSPGWSKTAPGNSTNFFKSRQFPSFRVTQYDTPQDQSDQDSGGEEGSTALETEDATGDADTGKKKRLSREELREKVRNNPVTRDLDFSWFREKYRMEKLFISIGIVSLTMGVPFILSGVLCYVIQPTDQTELGNTLYFSLIGVGSGLMATGTGFVIGGAVSLHIKKKNNRIQVGFLPY